VQDWEQVQKPIYFISKLLQGPGERYQAIEKATLAVVFTARRLRHYFQSPHPDPRGFWWIFLVDVSSNQQGSGAGDILEGPSELLIEQSLKCAFKANNNQAEYEALIAKMLLSWELGAQSLLVKSDSLLVTEQVTGRYQAKDPQLAAYLKCVMKEAFIEFELVHVPKEQNSRTDLLAKLASSRKGNQQSSVIQETLKAPRMAEENPPRDILVVGTQGGRIHRSLTQETLKVPWVVACEALKEEVMTISQGSTTDT